MSSPSGQGGASQDRPKSLSKYMRRASKVLRPKSVATAPETPQPAENAPGSPMITFPTFTTLPAPLASNPPAGTDPTPTTTNPAAALDPVSVPRADPRDLRTHSKQQQEKARALFEKYRLDFQARDWTPPTRQAPADVAWVEKKIRMRIHRECHKCHTSFGTSKVCANCDHTRCKTCPRWPPKKATAESQQQVTAAPHKTETGIEGALPVAISKVDTTGAGPNAQTGTLEEPEATKENTDPALLAIDTTEQTDKLRAKHLSKVHQRRGADVVYRQVHHRVRRICHKCDTLFKGRATDCENCGHQRCPSCPRDPSKFTKYPDGLGYPGDVPEPEPLYPSLERVYRKPRIRTRWTCHECNTVFASSNEKTCKGCKHTRCEFCTRDPVKREQKVHSEEVLRGLEGKLVGLKLLSSVGTQAMEA